MKTLKLGVFLSILVPAILIVESRSSFGQTIPNFTGISATPEGAIQLMWNSTSNETYEIDEADALGTNADGSTAWNQLYTEYPSQGTDTFWLDTGNYSDVPPIVHPKYSPARYYRVVDLGPDTTSDEPTVSITGPTNGAIVSGDLTVTVVANTDQAGDLSTLLYVDGQEMPGALSLSDSVDNGTNSCTATFVINSCEWWNGQHTLFATARCESAPQNGEPNAPGPLVGHAVSTFVPVTFNNLVTEIAFSQPFFDPTLGQTQQVTAIFPLNSDWTLTITDANSNTVRTASGSGISMSFNWDGTGNGGTSLPAGVYWYYVSAQTNGQALVVGGGGEDGGSGGGSPPAPDSLTSGASANAGATQLWAQPSDGSGIAVPLMIYPPGFDTNNLTIFEAPVNWNPMAAVSATPATSSTPMDYGSPMGNSGGGPSAPGGQSAPAAPLRPPTEPVNGTAGTIGVVFQSYSENGAKGYTLADPENCYIGGPIKIQNFPTDVYLNFDPMPQHVAEANNFIAAMKKGAWNCNLKVADNNVKYETITGSGSPLNQVNLGLILLHGVYGSAEDWCYNGCEQMYFPLGNYNGGASWVNMGDMYFGGTGTNGLKWMAIDACFSLYQRNWNSMQDSYFHPYNSNLHLFLGVDSISFSNPNIESLWAQYMLSGPPSGGGPMTIQAAWYQGAHDAFHGSGLNYGETIVFAVAGDAACSGDTLQSNSPPGGGQWFYLSQQVWP